MPSASSGRATAYAPDEGGHQRSSEVIILRPSDGVRTCTQRSLAVIRGDQRSSERKSGTFQGHFRDFVISPGACSEDQ